MTKLLVALGLLFPAAVLHAEERCPPPRPPKVAVEACASRAAGDACAFDDDGHHVTGTCFTPDDDKPLACKPEDAK